MTFGEEQYQMIWCKKKKTQMAILNYVGLFKILA